MEELQAALRWLKQQPKSRHNDFLQYLITNTIADEIGQRDDDPYTRCVERELARASEDKGPVCIPILQQRVREQSTNVEHSEGVSEEQVHRVGTSSE